MKIGCCANMVAQQADGIGLERLETLAAAGYDYVELPLAQMMALDDAQFDRLIDRVRSSGIRCEACNNFFPAGIRLTGANADLEKAARYAEQALLRAERLGAKSIVFGSSGAKNVPEGFNHGQARGQIVGILRAVDALIGARDIQIAIEPLCRLESNIINTAYEGWQLAQDVNRSHIRLLVDFYHLSMEGEPPDIIGQASAFLQHMHIANPVARVYPAPGDGAAYRTFFDHLKRAGYDGRVSVEAYTDDFAAAAPRALAALREALR